MIRSLLFLAALALPAAACAQPHALGAPDIVGACAKVTGGCAVDPAVPAAAAAATAAQNKATTTAAALTALAAKEAVDHSSDAAAIAAANATVAKFLPISLSNSGMFTGIAPNGTSWTLQGSSVSATTLVADGTVAATINGSTFAWAHQPSGATVSGGDSGGTTTELNISEQPHAQPSNQAALVAKMLSTGSALTPACYSALMYVTDPAGQNYTSGLFLRNAAAPENLIFFNGGASPGGSYSGIDSETDFAHSNATNLIPSGNYEAAYPIGQQYYQKICPDGTNIAFYRSQTGAAGTFGAPYYTATASSLGNPTDIGFYEDAQYTNGTTTYAGVSHLVAFVVQLGYNPQAAAPTTVQTFANELTNSVFPTAADPVDNTAKPQGWPSADQSNLTNYASFVFGSANTMSPNCSACLITNRAQLDAHFEHNQLDGNAYTLVDTGPKDGYSNTGYTSIFRTYPAGDPHDTTVLTPNALQFKAFCSGLNGTVCQGKGNVVSGIIRPETVVQDDTVIEACMMRPNTLAGWFTVWVERGNYPPAGTTPVFYATGSASYYPTSTPFYLEHEGTDGYPINDGTAANFDLTPQTPVLDPPGSNVNATRQNISIHYAANASNGVPFSRVAGGYHTSYDQSVAMHCFQSEYVPPVFSDTAHTVVVTAAHIIDSVDGVEYQDTETNWEGGQQTDWQGNPLPGNPSTMSSVMIGLQYGPQFTPNADATMTPSNVAGAGAYLASLRFFKRTGGAHAAPTLPSG